MKNTFKSYDKEEILKWFKELKATGKPFTLGDTLRDEDGNIPKIPISESSSIVLENVNDVSFLHFSKFSFSDLISKFNWLIIRSSVSYKN
jgi:hypothetical protein